MPLPNESQYIGIGSRKPHRKSRLGCGNCKKRKIKCDETKPVCKPCARHSVICDYTQSATLPRSTASLSDHGGHESPFEFSSSTVGSSQSQHKLPSNWPASHLQEGCEEWGLLSLKLLQNYSTSTCYNFSALPILQDFFRLSIPEIGFSYPFVLHVALAVSALHLSRFDREHNSFYRNEADRRYKIALQAATSLMSQVDSENCHVLFTFANLCCFYTMAKGPQPGDFLLFGDQGVAEWLIFFKTLKPIIEMHFESLSRGVLAPIFQVGMSAANKLPTQAPEIEQLSQLRNFISETVQSESESQTMVSALDALSSLVSSKYSTDGFAKQFGMEELDVWLYSVSDEFVVLLQQRQPAALIIMAYFCVLLNDRSANWIMHGWVEHIMKGVHGWLGKEHQFWIRWPIEQIGWIPDS